MSFDALTNVASFTPEKPLALLGSYTASLSGTITDLSGNALIPASWSFTTRDGVWDATDLVENALGNADSPQIVVDTNGSTLVVWEQNDGIWVNRYTPSEGWGNAELIETNDAGSARTPKIAIDANGNALVVWRQDDGIRYNVWANRYTVGNGSWGEAELIETDDAVDAITPQIAFDTNNNALMIWARESNSPVTSLMASRYTAGGSWSAAEVIEIKAGTESPKLAVDANGNALAVWRSRIDGYNDIVASRFE